MPGRGASPRSAIAEPFKTLSSPSPTASCRRASAHSGRGSSGICQRIGARASASLRGSAWGRIGCVLRCLPERGCCWLPIIPVLAIRRFWDCPPAKSPDRSMPWPVGISPYKAGCCPSDCPASAASAFTTMTSTRVAPIRHSHLGSPWLAAGTAVITLGEMVIVLVLRAH